MDAPGQPAVVPGREILTARREPGVDPQAVDWVLHRLDLHSPARCESGRNVGSVSSHE